MAYCRKCGTEIADNAKFCPSCGQSRDVEVMERQQTATPSPTIVYVQSPQQQQQVYVHRVEKSKGVALLLCFFLGGL